MAMKIVSILSALLTPVVAVVTTYIAWQQWNGNKLNLKMDRYDRRLHVYQEVVRLLHTINADTKPKWEDLINFTASTAEATFLFGSEIPQYLEEIVSRAAKLRQAHAEYRNFKQPVPPGYDHNKVVDEMQSQLEWFTKQVFEAKDKFRKYLDIN